MAALVVLLAAAVALDVAVARQRDDVEANLRSRLRPAREELASLLTSLVDQETGQRGFLLTGDESFLEPYRAGRQETTSAIRSLRRLLADDRALLAGVERIRSRVQAWQQLAAEFEIDAKREGKDELVAALVASGTGKRLFEDAREEIGATRTAVAAVLADDEDRLAALEDRVSVVRLVSLVAIGVVLLLTAKIGRAHV